jgi:hypothetical protein
MPESEFCLQRRLDKSGCFLIHHNLAGFLAISEKDDLDGKIIATTDVFSVISTSWPWGLTGIV